MEDAKKKKEAPERPRPAVEIERTRFKSFLLQNPNYFGNLEVSDFKPVKVIQGNSTFEQMTCVGLNPPYDRLEAVLQIKRESGYSGDICRFPSAGHYARYNATAPIEASSGPVIRHRLNPRGNRQLNHAIHMIAVTQVRNDTPGRAYYLRKQAEGHSRKEAMRALKRRISDAVYGHLVIDSRR